MTDERKDYESVVGKQLADFALKASFEKNIVDLEKILIAQGATINRYHEDEIHISKDNFSTALILGSDPITCLVIIIMALWGPSGMLLPVVKVAFKKVNKQWSEIVKNAKKSSKANKLSETVKKSKQLILDF